MKKCVNFFSLLLVVVFTSCNTAQKAQAQEVEKEGLYAKIKTNKGEILLDLYYKDAPVTVANFVSLANGKNTEVVDSLKGKPFFNGLIFHRVLNDFMIQTGDPTGTGTNGPGYKFHDEIARDSVGNIILKHDKKGVLSMANSGKNTNGSQFFITHKPTPWLDGKHAVFGQTIKGLEVVDAIAHNDVMETIEIIAVGGKAKKFKAHKIFKKAKAEMDKKDAEMEQALAGLYNETKTRFEAANANAITTDSGLKYLVVESPENAEQPKTGQKVKINYAGYFTDGKLFDSNMVEVAKKYFKYDKNRDLKGGYAPFTEEYSNKARLVPGFKEGIQKLKIGEKAIFFIPSELAYGAKGAGSVIPPHTDIVFEVVLTEIVK